MDDQVALARLCERDRTLTRMPADYDQARSPLVPGLTLLWIRPPVRPLDIPHAKILEHPFD